jgi:nucleoside 2-deoxyribosyltransferase
MAKVASFAQSSPLFGQLDINGLRFATKSMLASLQLYEYHYSDEQPIAGEHGVYGVRPPEEYEESVKIADARKSFLENCDWAIDHLDLLSPSEHELPSAIMASQASVISKIRRNTAFIIMRMGGPRTEDEDIKDCIKQVFREFGVRAVRADDVEHQDVITKRILDEIATSEFQIADLTGERPSVYYEVGYAHALGQRPILYRKSGTPLHFDLAVHNVPEYDNIRDLRGKLRKRLAAITGKPAKDNSQEG